MDWISSSPSGNFFCGLASEIGLTYYSVSVCLNITVTCVICYRTVYHGMKVKAQLGPEYACAYFDVASIIVESVLPYTLSGIVFLVSFGLQSPLSITFVSVYLLLMVCHSQPNTLMFSLTKKIYSAYPRNCSFSESSWGELGIGTLAGRSGPRLGSHRELPMGLLDFSTRAQQQSTYRCCRMYTLLEVRERYELVGRKYLGWCSRGFKPSRAMGNDSFMSYSRFVGQSPFSRLLTTSWGCSLFAARIIAP